MTNHMLWHDRWQTDQVFTSSVFPLLFYVVVIWVQLELIWGLCWFDQPQSEIQSKSNGFVREGISSRPVHLRVRQSCGYMSESFGSYLQKRRPGLQMTLMWNCEGGRIHRCWPHAEKINLKNIYKYELVSDSCDRRRVLSLRKMK